MECHRCHTQMFFSCLVKIERVNEDYVIRDGIMKFECPKCGVTNTTYTPALALTKIIRAKGGKK